MKRNVSFADHRHTGPGARIAQRGIIAMVMVAINVCGVGLLPSALGALTVPIIVMKDKLYV